MRSDARHQACDNTGVNPRFFDCRTAWESGDLADAAALVTAGAVIVLPTDTVYGIGTAASEPAAVGALLATKGRGRQMPPPVLVASAGAIDELCVGAADVAHRLARAHWPGGLTLILDARPGLGWDLGDTGGTIALRMPDHPRTLELLEAAGPMAVTSANLTGQAPAISVDEAHAAFLDAIDAYIDAGPTPGATPSTIIDLAHGAPRVIRLGVLSLDQVCVSAGCDIASLD